LGYPGSSQKVFLASSNAVSELGSPIFKVLYLSYLVPLSPSDVPNIGRGGECRGIWGKEIPPFPFGERWGEIIPPQFWGKYMAGGNIFGPFGGNPPTPGGRPFEGVLKRNPGGRGGKKHFFSPPGSGWGCVLEPPLLPREERRGISLVGGPQE